MSFVHLHNHTHYSLLDGAAKIKDLVRKAAEFKMPGLAITDHGNMFGVLEFYKIAKSMNVKPIIGVEAYIASNGIAERNVPGNRRNRYHHLVLLAKNNTGYQNLLKLSSIAYLDGFYYKPRIDKDILRQHSEGLIASSACMKGEIFHLLNTEGKEAARKALDEYLEIFGDDFYLEIQNHGIPEEEGYENVYRFAKDAGVPVIATNDIHYLEKSHAESHDVLLCLQTGKDYDDPNRMRYGTDQLYMKSVDEMYHLFKDKSETLERTLEIYEKCNVEIDLGNYKLPHFPIPDEDKSLSLDDYLEKLTKQGLKEKYTEITPQLEERLKFELDTIKKMGFSGYFLIVQDFINYAKENGIPVGLGRGSAAGSLVAYTLGITGIDPLRYDLLFERFLNPHRQTMPDIDIDFCFERREEVIDYVKKKYGGDKSVVQIITFGSMLSKGVIKDVARVLGISYDEADKISKLIPVDQGKPMPVMKAFQEVPELKEMLENGGEHLQKLVKHATVLEGIARHASIHAAGIIIAPGDITDYVPLYKSTDGEVTTQWTMTECEEVGLLKMDFLGLRTLTVIHHAAEFVQKNHGIELNMDEVALDDPKTYELFTKGDTIGVFQFESKGMQEYLKKLKPDRIEDLVAMNALYRPGPMENIDRFIAGKENPDQVEYLHEKLEPILKETYGIIVYQEQVMRIASELAGFSLAEADIMRKAMGKKKEELMKQFEEKFITGCSKNGISGDIAAEIWSLIVRFAKYGFNKSHSVAYALTAYQTAYLKANYPAEYLAATLNSEIDNWDKVQFFMQECRRLGIEVLPPDVNTSEAYFTPTKEGTIVFGLTAIKNVGLTAVRSILEARERVGQFKNLFEFMKDVDTRLVNKKVLESLIVAGAMDSLDGNRKQKFMAIEEAIQFASKWNQKEKNKNQPTLFDAMSSEEDELDNLIQYPELPDVTDWTFREKLNLEMEIFGFYFSGHPLDKFKNEIMSFCNLDVSNLDETPYKKKLRVAGLIKDLNIRPDRRGKNMAFITFDVFDNNVEAIVYSSVFENISNLIEEGAILFAEGERSDYNKNGFKLIIQNIMPLENVRSKYSDGLCIRVANETIIPEIVDYFKPVLMNNPGDHKLAFEIQTNSFLKRDDLGGKPLKNLVLVSKKFRISLTDELISEAKRLFGDENVYFLEKSK
ncbi:MAG: DNA polymerase III subunit alpha [Calditrichia bacterium]